MKIGGKGNIKKNRFTIRFLRRKQICKCEPRWLGGSSHVLNCTVPFLFRDKFLPLFSPLSASSPAPCALSPRLGKGLVYHSCTPHVHWGSSESCNAAARPLLLLLLRRRRRRRRQRESTASSISPSLPPYGPNSSQPWPLAASDQRETWGTENRSLPLIPYVPWECTTVRKKRRRKGKVSSNWSAALPSQIGNT